MKVEYVQPFAAAAVDVLKAELGVEVQRGELSLHTDDFTTREVTVLIGITGEVEGTALYGADRETVNRMVTIMIGEPQTEFDETSMSAIAELGNVISGHAAAIFERQGIDCTISPPTVIVGAGTRLSTVGIPRLVIPFNTEIGTFEVAVSLREPRARR